VTSRFSRVYRFDINRLNAHSV